LASKKFLIVDDHPIVRVGIRQLITQEWPDAAIEEAETITDALRKTREWRPDLIVLDLAMPDTSGTEGVVQMLRVAGETPILILSFSAEDVYAARLLQMGVAGYLPKDRAGPELVTALKRLAEGKRYVTASMADQLVNALGGKGGPTLPHEQLSTQEHRVMLLIAAGKAAAEIAETMHLSVKTVGSYRARILEKTGWKNNIELTKYCVQHGLTDEL
jgi:two-component system, NarL family, invasion response regulator UvrY